ncbi:acetylornithine deacetylase [Halorhodospira abdelmalekii]|uniref:acetylornithine deacetylase n=1 Tax=Halorhodospira abdelmalekii TaxID=421629 RepID=UPI001906F97E|nr:acetylornithine deacetylase [Halorhodospira abdelmalekii]MBK1734365.1 acetylornithine deacetylase [Halorhodospira abdelmalekii]
MSRDLPELAQLIAELVAEPSVSSVDPIWDQSNLGVVERLCDWLEPLGFECRVEPLPEQADKANLIAILQPARSACGGDNAASATTAAASKTAPATAHPAPGGLALCGHTDTVPYDAARWSSDPFRLSERDGRLYGLGSCDMKGFLALAVAAVRDLDRRQLRAPLALIATADEESGMDGARALVAAYPEGIGIGRAIIGEPTSNRPVHLHKGMMMEAVHIEGRAGHSSDPRLGRNALEIMTRVLTELLRWRDELAERHRDERFGVPYPTLNLGRIHGGDNPNRICSAAELHFDLRPLPGMAPAALRAELSERLQAALGSDAPYCSLRSLVEPQPALATPATSALVAEAVRWTGEPATAAAFATEAPYFVQMGMESVVLGPGDIGCAHQPDEYIECARLQPTLEWLRAMIRRFCL